MQEYSPQLGLKEAIYPYLSYEKRFFPKFFGLFLWNCQPDKRWHDGLSSQLACPVVDSNLVVRWLYVQLLQRF